jgi:phage gpG-like protein
MTELEWKLKADQAKNRFIKLASKIENRKQIWEKFVPEYREIVLQNFGAKGKIMEQSRWMPLTAQYRKWKQKNYPGQPLLVLTGKLQRAAVEFKADATKDNLKMTVNGDDPYYMYVQERSKNPRKYFYTKNYSLPPVAWNILTKITREELEKE